VRPSCCSPGRTTHIVPIHLLPVLETHPSRLAGCMRCCWGCSTSYRVDVDLSARYRFSPLRATYVPTVRLHGHQQQCVSLLGSNPGAIFRPNRSTTVHLLAQSRRHSQRQRVRTSCSNNDSKSSNNRRPRRGWPPWNWFQYLPGLPRVVFNVTALFLLMRIWPLHGRSPLGQAQPVAVPVPFSEFIKQTEASHVSEVAIDNRNIKYTLHAGAPLFKDIPQGDEPINVAFQTTRPADYAMPYEALVQQDVKFSAVDNRNNPMLTVLVSLPCLCSFT